MGPDPMGLFMGMVGIWDLLLLVEGDGDILGTGIGIGGPCLYQNETLLVTGSYMAKFDEIN